MPGAIKPIILFLIFCLSAQFVCARKNDRTVAAAHVVSGIVRDAHTKEPLIAVEVKTLNGDASTTTNESGVFRLKVNSAKAILKVSTFDYNVREFAIQGKDSVVIDLFSDDFSNYYKTIEAISGAKGNTATTSSIKSVNDFSHSVATSADEALHNALGGDVRGIIRSGATGMGSALFIRGLNSVNANAQPLFVVDGVVWNNLYDVTSIHKGFFSNPLSNIDINDIESISLVKDGTSIYGSKAANGLVLIKTKRGTGTVTKINLNVITGVTTMPNTEPVMSADQYKTYVTDLIGTSGMTNAEISQLPYLNDNPARSTYNAYHNNTNWNDQVYQDGMSKNYSINVNGGDEKALYYLTLGYLGNTGVVKSNKLDRYNMRLNADIQMAANLNLGINVGFSRIDRKLTDDGVDNYMSPTWLSLIKSPFLSPYNFTSLGVATTEYTYYDIFNVGNPGGIIGNSNNTLKQNSFNITLKPVLQLSSAFSLSEHFDYNLNKTNEDYYRPYLYAAPVFITGIGDSENERRSQVMRNNSVFSDTRLNFKKQFNMKNKLNMFLGARYIVNYYESDYVEGHNSRSNSSVNLHGSFKNLQTRGDNNLTKSISGYLNAEYSADNRYFLNAVVSADGSSRFGSETVGGLSLFGHSWGIFPAISGSWLVSGEKFMKDAKAFSLLKLRAGYGITGNDDIKDYQTSIYFSSIRFKDVANGMILWNLANPQIQWETTARANAGLDMGLFNDRLAFSVDVYSSVTDKLLMLKQYQEVAGLNAYWGNGGTLTNQGVEFSMNTKLFNFRNLRWELGVSAGHYKNRITELPSDTYNTSGFTNGSYVTKVYDGEVLTSIGNPAGVFYGYKSHGVFSTQQEADNAGLKIQNSDGTYSAFGAGDVFFMDMPGVNGIADGIIDENDKQIIGDPNPVVYGTINNKFVCKNFTLSALFKYSYGNDVYNYKRSQLEAGRDYYNQSKAMLSRWVTEGQATLQPRAVYGDPLGNARFSDRWIEDGSYIRLKSLTLSYDLPLKSNFLQGINVWLSADNVFTLTKYLGADPEFSAHNSVLFQGVDAGLVPLSRSYYLGFKFNL